MKSKIAAASLALSMMAGAAYAAPIYTAAPAGSKCPRFDVSGIINSIDTNHDTRMTEAEWKAAGAPPTSFAGISQDSGVVTTEAFAAATPPPTIDANGDCALTLSEMKAMENGPPGGAPGAGAPPPR